jgi:hypothetical protein
MMKNRRWLIVTLALGLGMAGVLLALVRTGMAQPESPAATSAGGPPFPIIAISSDHQNPAVAYDEGRDRYLVVYEAPSGGQAAVCVDPDGTIVRIYTAGSGQHPDVVYSADHDQYLIVYDSGGNIEGQFVSGSCCMQVGCIGAPFVISGDRPSTEYGPAVAYNTNSNHQDYLAVWTDTGGFGNGVYARQILSAAQTPNPSFAITDTTAAWNYEPDVAYNLNRNEYLVVYTHDSSKGGDPNALDIYGRLVKNFGGVAPLAENPINTSANVQQHATVAAHRLNYETPYLVAFDDYWNDPAGDVRAYLVFTTGVPSTPINIATVSGRQEILPDLASSEPLGGFTAVWMQENGSDWDVYWRRVNDNGFLYPSAPVVAVVGKSEEYPTVAGGIPTTLAVWQEQNADWDIYARCLDYHKVYLPLVLRNE